jgi:membrane protein YdbS with pleckstrin-like domain
MAVASVSHTYVLNLHSMLTREEEKFVEFWEANRLERKKVLKQLYVGLPFASLLVIAIVINFFSGWYKRADMKIRSDSSPVLVIIIACILIVVFTTVFSVRHKWDMNEQLYKELLSKRDQS